MTDPRVAIVRRWLGESNNCYGTVDGLLSRLDAARDEAGGPAWRDEPIPSEGWWLLVRELIPMWIKHFDLMWPKPGDRWFGPVVIPEDTGRKP